MKFTKEYIKECDCEVIQDRKPMLEEADFISNGNKIFYLTNYEELAGEYVRIYAKSVGNNFGSFTKADERRLIIWLPTGDQLDDEIVKIIEVGINYTSAYCKATDSYVAYIEDDETPDDYITYYSTNPLMAKIKLLKVILEYK